MSTEVVLTTLATDVKKILEAMKTLQTDVTEMKSAIKDNVMRVNQLETKLNNHVNECECESKTSRKLIRTIHQNNLKNDIILKGFPDGNFDVNEVKQNIIASCAIENGLNHCYKFSRSFGIDKSTKQRKQVHFIALSFISSIDKAKVFTKLKSDGHFTLGDLVAGCPNDEKTVKIWVEHSVTPENLIIRKSLSQLKKDGTVDKFSLRSGIYVIEYKDLTGKNLKATIYESSQLEDMFKFSSERKRGRSSSSTSPNGPFQKLSRPENVSKSSSELQRKPNN